MSVRAVLDVNVIISALLSGRGAPARALRAWLHGEFELVVSPALLTELKRTLAYPKVAERISASDTDELLELLSRSAVLVDDPPGPPPVRSADPDDDYVISLAADARAVIVSGDHHLTDLAGQIPVYTLAQFLELLAEQDRT